MQSTGLSQDLLLAGAEATWSLQPSPHLEPLLLAKELSEPLLLAGLRLLVWQPQHGPLFLSLERPLIQNPALDWRQG